MTGRANSRQRTSHAVTPTAPQNRPARPVLWGSGDKRKSFQMPKKPNPLPAQSYLRKRLTYYPDTGLLFWRVRPESDFSTWKSLIRWRSCLAMREAFTATTRHGHKAGQIDGVPYLAHRIIWKIFYGFDPEIIDHIDRDPSNNRIFVWLAACFACSRLETHHGD